MKIKAVVLLFFIVIFLFGCNGPAAKKNADTANGSLSASEQADSFSTTDLTDTSLKAENPSDVTQITSETTSPQIKGEATAGDASNKPSTTKSVSLTTIAATTKTTATTKLTSTAKSATTTKPVSTTKSVITTKPVTTTKPPTTTVPETTTNPATTTMPETTIPVATTKPAATIPATTTKPATTLPQTTAAGGTVKLYISCINAVKDGIRNRGYDFIPADGIMLNTDVELQQGDTVLSLLQRVLKEKDILLNNKRGYIAGIGGLNEKACGSASGWKYRVNGVFPGYGCDQYNLKNGDKIEFLYTVTPEDVTNLSG